MAVPMIIIMIIIIIIIIITTETFARINIRDESDMKTLNGLYFLSPF